MIVYRNLKPLVLCRASVDFRIMLENDRVICRVAMPEEIPGYEYSVIFNYLYVQYNGERKRFDQLTSRRSEASFDYVEGNKTVELLMDTLSERQMIYYDGIFYGVRFPITWRGPYESPICTFATPSVHEDFGNSIVWTLGSPVGYPCSAVELLYYEKAPEDAEYICTKLFGRKYDGSRFIHTLPEGKTGNLCYYRLAYCSYPYPEAVVDDYLTYGEFTTEVFVIGGTRKYPNAPATVTSNRPAVGGYAHVTWDAAADSFNEITEYELERQINGGEWVPVYRGSSTAFRDKLTVSAAEEVVYRVRSVDTEGQVSDWRVSKVLAVVKSNIFVMSGGVLRPAAQVYIGGRGEVGAVAFVG